MLVLPKPPKFEVKTTDLGGRIGSFTTKTSTFETPALLPVIHPTRQLVPCTEIRGMGYEAVMTNAYTTFRRLKERASEGIHRLIGYDGSIMTDSGGYQVLEFGAVDVGVEEMARFEEQIGSDIAIILDRPTGLDVTRKFASDTVRDTLEAARRTEAVLTREDMIWTLPIQGGKYLDLVRKSARQSSTLGFGCHALGSPVEVMEEYDFSLLVRMIISSKTNLPDDRPFHLFGAGHPLILPLAVALGCDMFDSASYMLYAKQDRYISTSGTIRLEKLEYLPCSCKVCTNINAAELRKLKKEERTIALARHNLYALKKVIDETKQAIWEGRLWEYIHANSLNHPKAYEAFKLATLLASKQFDEGTPESKDRGIFISNELDTTRPEVTRFREKLKRLDFPSTRDVLLVVPETRKKPFLTSDIYDELKSIVSPRKVLITFLSENYGLVPAEISDIFPLSQTMSSFKNPPTNDPIFHGKKWKQIHVLAPRTHEDVAEWIKNEARLSKSKRIAGSITVSKSYKQFKKRVSQV